ncbi:MAG: hypothetical protein ACI9K3_000825, partial [Halovenus sp.]
AVGRTLARPDGCWPVTTDGSEVFSRLACRLDAMACLLL